MLRPVVIQAAVGFFAPSCYESTVDMQLPDKRAAAELLIISSRAKTKHALHWVVSKCSLPKEALLSAA